MVKPSKFIYYTILRNAKVIVIIIGIIVAVMAFIAAGSFAERTSETTEEGIGECKIDATCYYNGRKCVPNKPAMETNPPEGKECACINETCSLIEES